MTHYRLNTASCDAVLRVDASTLGFRNLTNYRIRSLLETGGFRPLTHSLL